MARAGLVPATTTPGGNEAVTAPGKNLGVDPGTPTPPARLRRVRSPFVRFLSQRLALLPVQLLFVLVILFVFGSVLPAVWEHESACALAGGSCTCPWSNVVCSTGPFFSALGTFVDHIITGKWGKTSYFGIIEPTAQYFRWWLPNSIELAVVALGIAGVTAYFVGIRAGWRPGGALDGGARSLAAVGLLLPAFFLIFFLLISSWTPYLQYLGDTPYGTLPGALWLDAHGGIPKWIGIAGTTSPTGFPIIDAFWHGDVPFALNVLARTLLQGAIIAIAYLAIFFRYARHAVGEALREPYVLAARARGVPDRTVLWHHASRRVIPIYALVFAGTLPAYIVTQAIAEAVYNYNGIGTLVMYNFSVGGANVAGFDQVAIFLLAAVILGGTLFADILSRALDPRFRR
jgi:ABC-type dipeptide/oligopeptide/nickel transport system permease component